MKKSLTNKQKEAIRKCAYREAACALDSDYADPFKHRELPDLGSDDDKIYGLADDYFFKCIKDLAVELEKRGK